MPRAAVEINDEEMFELLKRTRAGNIAEAIRVVIESFLDSKNKNIVLKNDTGELAQKIAEEIFNIYTYDRARRVEKKLYALEDKVSKLNQDIKEKDIKEIDKKIKEVQKNFEQINKQMDYLTAIVNELKKRKPELNLNDAELRNLVREIFEEREVILEDYFRTMLRDLKNDIDNFRTPNLKKFKEEVEKLKAGAISPVQNSSQENQSSQDGFPIKALSLSELKEDKFANLYHLILAIKLVIVENLKGLGFKAEILHIQEDGVVFRVKVDNFKSTNLISGVVAQLNIEALKEEINKRWKELSQSNREISVKPIAGEDYVAEIK